MSAETDERLYRQMLNGDETALNELVGRYHRPIYQFLCRYTADPALADDMAQETFIRVLKYRGTAPRRFKSWIFAIAANLARDHFRSAGYRYEQTVELSDDIAIGQTGIPENHGEDIAAALAQLSPEQRETIILRFYHDLQLDEIAEITGAPLGTVKSRLFHALKGLKGFLAIMEHSYDRA